MCKRRDQLAKKLEREGKPTGRAFAIATAALNKRRRERT